jgi:hypothetical protein
VGKPEIKEKNEQSMLSDILNIVSYCQQEIEIIGQEIKHLQRKEKR